VRRKMRDTTLNALLHTAQTAQHPLLIMGDFNMSDLSSDYQHLSDHLQDGWRGVGYGLGFTAPNIRLLPPYARVDYVWHSGPLQGGTRANTANHVRGSSTAGGGLHAVVMVWE
jgi:endonuclease/exonuclease/phosphatase family metal-dependent hydrolase